MAPEQTNACTPVPSSQTRNFKKEGTCWPKTDVFLIKIIEMTATFYMP